VNESQREELNYFFVHVFNQILAYEEQALNGMGAGDLSVKELHVLEAVGGLTAAGRNTMTQIADALSIRVSSLTTAVNTLVRTEGGFKGYNTDMPGLYRAMSEDGLGIEGEDVLILGAGGVARAVAILTPAWRTAPPPGWRRGSWTRCCDPCAGWIDFFMT